MNIIYTGKKVDITPDLKAWVEKKLVKLDKYFQDDCEVKLVIGRLRNRFTVECTVINRGTVFRVEEIDEDAYTAIDRIVPAIDRQIRKNKTRLAKRLREGALDDLPYHAPYEAEEETEFNIVRKKLIHTKPMSPEEAILQMNLLGHDFFIFMQEDENHPSLVYKRKDGDYGMIELSED